ncbi:MAG: hypothetical protein P4L87_11825, partial [Formivibrio sp.]|nr:hypothetical protein [Formivibrio sp.]
MTATGATPAIRLRIKQRLEFVHAAECGDASAEDLSLPNGRLGHRAQGIRSTGNRVAEIGHGVRRAFFAGAAVG